MAVIKSVQTGRLLKEAIVLDMGDLGLHAQRITQSAKDQAARIIEEARREAHKLTDAASETGHRQGLEKGLQEGREIGRREGRELALREIRDRLEPLANAWSAALNKWETDRAALFHDSHADVIRLAVELGNKVVRRLVQTDGTIVKDQIIEAMKHLGKSTAVEIVVHPADRPLLDEVLPELSAVIVNCRHVSIRTDDSMLPGGCIVTSAGGRIDARIETQLERIAAALVGDTAVPEPPPIE